MRKTWYILMVFFLSGLSLYAQSGKQNIYHKGWIDFNKNGKKDIYEDPAQPIDKRVEDLLSQMSLEEKTCQMATLYGYGRVLKEEMPSPSWKNEIWKDGIGNIDEELNSVAYNKKSVTAYSYPFSKHAAAINAVQKWFVEETPHGIPVDFTNEGIRGLCHDRATSFPSQIGQGSTWDKSLVYQIGKIEGREARALGYTNVYAPILDVSQDQRWGRVVETYGEDPFLIGQLGKQMVLGMQDERIVSTLKHFAVYSIPKGGRDGNARTDPKVAPREMQQMYLYPFKVAVKEAGALGVMASYNDWDGVPIIASKYFLNDFLRQQWGFKGYVVSDSRAVEYVWEKHHVASDYKDAIRQVVEAGLNIRTDFTMPQAYINPLREDVKEGRISLQTLDQRVREILHVKFALGLFDQPYVENPAAADKIVRNEEAVKTSLKSCQESVVLLKNENHLLPFSRTQYKSILVTGPAATEITPFISRYGPSNLPVVSMLDGMKKVAGPGVNIEYAKGCNTFDKDWPENEIIPTPPPAEEQALIDEAVARAAKVDAVVVYLGDNEETVGESRSRTSLDLPGHQLDLLQALYKTGKPIVLVLVNGRPLTINWADRNVPSILDTWFPGEFGGLAVAQVLFGDYNPGGKLSITFPRTVGQLPFNFPVKPGSQAGQPGEGPNGKGKTRIVGALYPFGFGLSYTTFEYSALKIDPKEENNQGLVNVSADVQNTGKIAGDEVVELYIHEKTNSVIEYQEQLRGFERIHLEPGEKRTVSFTLKPDDLAILDRNMNWTVEPGEFEVKVGSSSEDIRLHDTFLVK